MAQEGLPLKSLQTLILDLPPSCIEFCPSYPDYFVVGTYDLQKHSTAEIEKSSQPSQKRNGSLIVFHLDGENV